MHGKGYTPYRILSSWGRKGYFTKSVSYTHLGKLSQGLDPELEGEPDGIEATPNIVSRTVGGLYRVIGSTHYRKGDP